MRVLVAGATGHLGRPLVRQLASAGHQVAGTTRTPRKQGLLKQLGADPIVIDALDRAQVQRAVSGWGPEAIVHALTAIPAAGPLRHADLEMTDRLRRTGTLHLVDAARDHGVRRLVAESMVFAYGLGDHGPRPLTENEQLPDLPTDAPTRDHVTAVRELEQRIIRATARGEIEGIALRYGLFYGPGGGWERMSRLLHRRLLPLPGGGRGLLPWIHIEDAAAAIVAALEYGEPGEIYNVVDDQPAAFRDLVDQLARELDLPQAWSLPSALSRRLVPYATQSISDTRLVVSNHKAKHHLDWTPHYPSYVEGIQDLARQITADEQLKHRP